MNEKKQLIALIEYQGWQKSEGVMHYDGVEMPWTIFKKGNETIGLDRFPNPLVDLDAMHELEKFLTEYGDRAVYLNNIYGIIGREKKGRIFDESIGSPIDNVPFASARQRAEAFLRTIGKWEE